MRIALSNRSYRIPSEKETLAQMARGRKRGADGEISGESSSESMEETSADDFIQEGRGGGGSRYSRGWMGYDYPVIPRNYASDLYSIAWKQAVQDKPLEFNLNKNKPAKEEASNIVIEEGSEDAWEKEEGELEEGEIGFGLEVVEDNQENAVPADQPENGAEKKEPIVKEAEEIGDFDRRVSEILEELETITVEEAEASFETVCSRLRRSFENLKPMWSGNENSDMVLGALVQQAFMGIHTVYSVLNSDKLKNKEQNKELLLKLLIHIKNQYSLLLGPDQISEIDALVNSLVFEDLFKDKETRGENRSNAINMASIPEGPGFGSRDSVSMQRPSSESRIVKLHGNKSGAPGVPKLEVSISFKNRAQFGPLVDLHAKIDTDNLPSPTRDNPPGFPMPKPIGFGAGHPMPSQLVGSKPPEGKDTALHRYAKDAVRAVSSYQQKWTNLPASNGLHSPTPSEECNNEEDVNGEVSSCPVSSTLAITNTSNPFKSVMPSSNSSRTKNMTLDPPGIATTAGPVGSVCNHAMKSTTQSRDPRLRSINLKAADSMELSGRVAVDSDTKNNGQIGAISSSNRKHKQVDDSIFQSMKRQRYGLPGPIYNQTKSGVGMWSDCSNTSDSIKFNEKPHVEIKKPVSGEVGLDIRPDSVVSDSGYKQNISANPSAISLPNLLKNPTALVQLIKIEQQRIASENQYKTAALKHDLSNVSTVNGINNLLPLGNNNTSMLNETGPNSIDKSQILTSPAHQNTQIRLKPRDPRRALHSNLVQKNEIMGSEQERKGAISSNIPINMEPITPREQIDQTQTSGFAPPAAPKPDNAQQFLTHLQNIVSRSQPTTFSPSANSSQSNLPKKNPMEMKIATPDSNDSKRVSTTSESSTTGAKHSPSPWGDVDHLLDGFDDEQKAAIQKERARRIAEQNKMFAAKKLCLVLDLDHTLLNSAKFVEIDPAHEEILRKKEEQDHEKPQRHLFRFQHMGMWTKLRPGIWNFLEKASELYELHVYTMGNKLYATEMAKVLDPTGNLFSGRVMSRGDDSDSLDGDERVPKSKDLDGVLGMESAVVIIDDSVKVWPHNKLNLIVVERYTYFPCSRRQFGLPGPSLLEIDHDERPEDGTLASSLAVIERIHQIFFSHRSLNDIDVRNILADEQHKILAGCRIVFSRIFPVGEANPHLHPLWQMAEQFGAVCTNQIDEQVTHVVAHSLGTDKVNWALSTGRFVVQPGWVEASALLYRRANEHDFAIKL